jgi:hypothetical protein
MLFDNAAEGPANRYPRIDHFLSDFVETEHGTGWRALFDDKHRAFG